MPYVSLRDFIEKRLEPAGELVRVSTPVLPALEMTEIQMGVVIAGTVDECAAELAALTELHDLDEFLVPVFDTHTGADLLDVTARVLAGS